MKKQRHRKLQLNRETLKSLEPGQLEKAMGGTHFSGLVTCFCTDTCNDTCNCPILV